MASGIEGGALAERRPEAPCASPGLAYARRNAVALLLAGAVIASGALLLALGSRLSFFLDDWTFLVYRQGFSAETILAPHNEHIAVGLILVYKALLALFGMDSTIPFRFVSTSVFLLSTVLLFFMLRRRVGPWPALLGATLVLFLGAAWEDLLWPFQLGYFASMAAGLGMLLALERGERRDDLIACVLLAVSIAFSSVGLPFAVGAAVHVLLHPRRLGRAWIFALPLALFALWYLGYGRDAPSAVTLGNVATAPLYLFDGVASSISSLLGLAAPRDEVGVDPLYWGRPLLVLGILAAAWRLRSLDEVPRWVLILAAIMATFWLLAGASEKEGRPATASRYVYLGAIFVLLLGAELARGWRPSRTVILTLCAGSVLAIAANLSYLHGAYTSYRGTSVLERAGLGAFEIAADRVDPALTLTEDLAGTGYAHIDAGSYLDAVEKYGSPAFTPDEIAASTPPAQEAADRTLAAALDVELMPLGAAQPESGGCRALRLEPGTPALAPLLPGQKLAFLPGDGARADVGLRRFAAEGFPVELGRVSGEPATVAVPVDRATAPWELELRGRGAIRVCPTQ